MGRLHKTAPVHYLKAANDGSGTFEAIVAVFNNIDLGGDRILEGAFTDTLNEWRAAGDPIPIIFSHQWDDLDAHVGEADPNDVKELAPGDPLLPAALAELGGLYVKGSLEIDEDPQAKKLHRKLGKRLIKEFSFAYDVRAGGSKRADDGATDLTALDLFEIGPTLKGMNPETVLVSAKALKDLTPEQRAALLSVDPEAAKAQVTLAGSLESRQAAISGAVRDWAEAQPFGPDLYVAAIEATFEDTVIIYVELWADPLNGGRYYQAGYVLDDAGAATLGEPNLVNLVGVVEPKAAAGRALLKAARLLKEGRRNSGTDQTSLDQIHDLAVTAGAKCIGAENTADQPDESSSADRDTTPEPKALDAAAFRNMIATELELIGS